VVDLVAAALRELYEESFVEENLVPESSSTSKDTAPLLSSSRPLLPPQARLPPSTAAALSSPNTEKANQNVPGVNSPAEVGAGSSSEAVGGTTGATNIAENEKDVINISRIEKNSSDHSDNVQRKIQVWWEGLELGASDALAGRQLNGKGAPRQSGLVVCATLVDKTPNVAGLTRTCEIFGASSLVIPNLGIVQSDTFKQISVTAEGWLPLEEVRPCDLLPWLQRKKREGFTVVGLEQTAKSVPLAGLGSKALPARTVLLLGKEKEGIPVEYLREVVRKFTIRRNVEFLFVLILQFAFDLFSLLVFICLCIALKLSSSSSYFFSTAFSSSYMLPWLHRTSVWRFLNSAWFVPSTCT
jgi:tRNA G18 (ribose-2'-O)-methylase SpoU